MFVGDTLREVVPGPGLVQRLDGGQKAVLGRQVCGLDAVRRLVQTPQVDFVLPGPPAAHVLDRVDTPLDVMSTGTAHSASTCCINDPSPSKSASEPALKITPR